ncbi:MAG: DUF1592 domain-containing protein [Deltaproteobacteria bacterium]|nr:DUF1592 domain-containing protein [Deltaproteobacteria bacterium]
MRPYGIGLVLVALASACSEAPPASALRCTPPAPAVEPTPGFRRLTTLEYDNTLRDLLGDTSRPSRGFSRDPVAYLFTTNAEAQRVSPVDLERWMDAAEAVIERAWTLRDQDPAPVAVGDFRGARVEAPGFPGDEAFRLTPDRPLGLRLGRARGPSALSLRVRAPEGQRLEVSQHGEALAFVSTPGPLSSVATVTAVVHPDEALSLPDGRSELVLSLVGEAPPEGVLVAVDVAVAPFLRDDQRLPRCAMDPVGADTCARRVLEGFAPRAWRRPVAPGELDALLGLYTTHREAEGPEAALKLALQAVLLSPRFTFLAEPPEASRPDAPLSAYELASRLSYFLWSSVPDETLLEAARSGRLREPSELEAQTRRMVADWRFQGFLRGFAGHWLAFEGLRAEDPTSKLFPELRVSAVGETTRFAAELFRADRPLGELLSADHAWVDGTLGAHYQLPVTEDSVGFRRTPLTGSPRRGLLTQASYLAVTSTVPTTTQPTLRGLYILARLLCDAPDPPPANANFDSFAMAADMGPSLRRALEQHRQRPECAGCHRAMDPLGFAFERYDTLGRYRQEVPGGPPDTSGEVEGVGRFRDALELSGLLQGHPRLTPCLTQHLLTYALGRNVADSDPAAVQAIARANAANAGRLLDLLVRVVTSPAFARRAPGGSP